MVQFAGKLTNFRPHQIGLAELTDITGLVEAVCPNWFILNQVFRSDSILHTSTFCSLWRKNYFELVTRTCIQLAVFRWIFQKSKERSVSCLMNWRYPVPMFTWKRFISVFNYIFIVFLPKKKKNPSNYVSNKSRNIVAFICKSRLDSSRRWRKLH